MRGRTVIGFAALMVLAPVAVGAQIVESSYLDLVEWRLAGPTRGGRVLAVAGDPVDDFTFYQGTAGGGVWKTTDGGIHWTNISDGYFHAGSVGAIAVVAVGYPGRQEDLDEETRRKDERPRARKDIGEIAFLGRFGEPFRAALPSAPAKAYEADIPLRFGDIDAMGHVNNAATLTLLELGRLKFFFEVFETRKVEDIPFILAEANVRYRIPILLQDRVRLRMHVAEVSRSSFRFRCELFDPRNGRVFTEAETVQVMYDYTTGRPRPIDAPFLEKIREYIGG